MATLSSSNAISSNIPMAEPSADINRSERLYPPNNNDSKDANLRKSKQKDTSHKRSGTLETRLDYAVSFIV